MSEIRGLNFKRATVKRKISNALTRVEGESTPELIESCVLNLNVLLETISSYNQQINDLYSDKAVTDTLSPEFLTELDSQSDYVIDIQARILELKSSHLIVPISEPCPNSSVRIKLPELNCPIFSGEKPSELQFYTFYNQFQNVIEFRTDLTNSTKLTYLKGYLSGYALKIVQYLGITDDNFTVALGIS